MSPGRLTERRLVGVLLAGALVGAVVTWLALRAQGADAPDAAGPAAPPACADLLGTQLGPLGEDQGWNGCVTDGGAAVQSHRYACSGLRRSLVPRGEEPLADEAAVVFLPDAGLTAAAGQPWSSRRAPVRPTSGHPSPCSSPTGATNSAHCRTTG